MRRARPAAPTIVALVHLVAPLAVEAQRPPKIR